MLISRERRFIFIHVAKTAGTSIERALAPYADPNGEGGLGKRLALLGPLARLPFLRDHLRFGIHASARQVRACLGPRRWEEHFTFAIVRNPYSRLLSRYKYILGQPSHAQHAAVSRLGGFGDYVRWEADRGRARLHQHFDLCDGDGRVLVNHVGRFERLRESFDEITRRLGLKVELPHLNATKHDDYRAYYDAATRAVAARLCARDLELFGYDFDGDAAR